MRSACSESAGFRARYQGSVGLPEYSVLGFRERGRQGRRANRLQDKFGSRWNMKTTVTVSAGQNGSPATATDDEISGVADRTGAGPTRRPRRGRSVKVIRTGAVPGGADQAGERSTAVDIPRYRFGRSGEFERDWHLALWAPNDPDGPTVIVNIESPVLEEIVKHHQSDYPDVFAEEVGKTVRQVFGEVATCKIAHSQKLAKKVPAEVLDREYRSEQALTIALMGLMAEESLIAQRLGKLGRKKGAT